MIWWAAIIFGIVENCYYGWNWWPSSDAELICDGIFGLTISLAYVERAILARNPQPKE